MTPPNAAMTGSNAFLTDDRRTRVMKKAGIGGFIFLQISFLIYSCSSIVAKIASGNEVMSFKFILFYGLEVVILGVYAILWQQVIKKFELSVAYANKAVTLMWALLWSVLLFHEKLKWNLLRADSI